MSLQLFGNADNPFASKERKIVKFAVGDINCAVDIMHVREIIQARDTSPLPSGNKSIVGVIDHRDAAVPVMDLRLRFETAVKKNNKQKWIIIAIGDRSVALVVDSVFGVSTVHQHQRRDHSSLGEDTDVSWAEKVYGDNDGLLFEIDLAHLSQTIAEK